MLTFSFLMFVYIKHNGMTHIKLTELSWIWFIFPADTIGKEKHT
jgi:hypothetical protein